MPAAKLLQLCPTLCDPIDGSPPGSADPGIFQARILEWVAIAFSMMTSITAQVSLAVSVLCINAAAAKSLQSGPTLWDPILNTVKIWGNAFCQSCPPQKNMS